MIGIITISIMVDSYIYIYIYMYDSIITAKRGIVSDFMMLCCFSDRKGRIPPHLWDAAHHNAKVAAVQQILANLRDLLWLGQNDGWKPQRWRQIGTLGAATYT